MPDGTVHRSPNGDHARSMRRRSRPPGSGSIRANWPACPSKATTCCAACAPQVRRSGRTRPPGARRGERRPSRSLDGYFPRACPGRPDRLALTCKAAMAIAPQSSQGDTDRARAVDLAQWQRLHQSNEPSLSGADGQGARRSGTLHTLAEGRLSPCQNCLLGRYWIASARCTVWMRSLPARSAIVRASFRMRWYARAVICSCCIAARSSARPVSSSGQ